MLKKILLLLLFVFFAALLPAQESQSESSSTLFDNIERNLNSLETENEKQRKLVQSLNDDLQQAQESQENLQKALAEALAQSKIYESRLRKSEATLKGWRTACISITISVPIAAATTILLIKALK